MGWAKLDDAFPTNPKVVGLSDRAFRAYIVALCYAAQHMTDGFLPAAWVAIVVPRKQRQQLEMAELWEVVPGGWQIHDYLLYNPSRSQIEAKRAADSERKRKGFRSDSDPESEQESDATPRARARSPGPAPPVPPEVGVDPDPDTPVAVGIRGEAAPEGEGNGHKPFHLADVVNLGLVVSAKDRYRRRKAWDGVTEGLLTGLVLGGKNLPACGARAVNAAIDDLYANAENVPNPAGYLRERAEAHAAGAVGA